MATTFETTDLDVASAALSQGYGSVKLRSGDRQTSLSLVQHDIGEVRLDRIRYRMSFKASAPPMGFLPICRVTEGSVTYHSAAGDRLYQTGDVFLCARPDEPAVASVVDLVTVEIAALAVALLNQVAQNAGGSTRGIRLLDHAPISPAAAARWWETYDLILAAATDPAAQTSALYQGHAARFLAVTALTTFPNTSSADPDATDRHDAHPASLRRAVAFIEAHPDRDLTPADIAESAGVSIRALQLTFRRHLGTTPMAHLRRVRLANVRDELVIAHPADTTVAAIAARWGFFNLGRFAGQYRTEFGELPHQTLNS